MFTYYPKHQFPSPPSDGVVRAGHPGAADHHGGVRGLRPDDGGHRHTDYWLYARAFHLQQHGGNNSSQEDSNNKDKKDPGALTHSGLWRICCLEEGLKRGVCSQINHFPDDADYDQDAAEYLLRVVRASSIFPILSAILLLLGGVCVASSGFYKSKRNIILGGGILFVAAGLSNIIGVIVYISAALSDISPKKDEDKKWHYSYGWSFYFGGLSFILAEMVGVLAVNIYIEKNKELRCRSRTDLFKSTTHAMLRLPSYRFRRRSRSSSRSTDPPHSQETSPIGASKTFSLPPSAPPFSVATLPNPHHTSSGGSGGGGDISMYTLSRDSKLGSLGGGAPPLYGTVDRATLYSAPQLLPKRFQRQRRRRRSGDKQRHAPVALQVQLGSGGGRSPEFGAAEHLHVSRHAGPASSDIYSHHGEGQGQGQGQRGNPGPTGGQKGQG
ncbi:hypothetical protein L3Q82_003192 [Scortum barcoo]|uniref:Uncharacterized protein n=1 Tax=Scortum barcoo TaxID=214431 RepID=A0ACB8VUI7_9TELE|nr:hypothetical protein L3Q82_003192 [Scortum barcoo]